MADHNIRDGIVRFNAQLDALLGLTQPQNPAQTVFDHEEWSRHYLSLLTNTEFQRLRDWAASFPQFLKPLWSDHELITKARMHAEAAKIVKGLDDLHEGDEADG